MSELKDSHMVIARIPDPVMPVERGSKYEDPLTAALQERGFGECTGGGTQLNAEQQIAFVDLEIMLSDLDGALIFTKETLQKLGAPKGSELHFQRDGQMCKIPVMG
jgi:hypothetical protein